MNHSFPDFSLTHLKFPDFLTFFQNSLTFPWLKKLSHFSRYSRFSSVGGNPVWCHPTNTEYSSCRSVYRYLFAFLSRLIISAAFLFTTDTEISWFFYLTYAYTCIHTYLLVTRLGTIFCSGHLLLFLEEKYNPITYGHTSILGRNMSCLIYNYWTY